MSNIAIQGSATGTGVFTIASPATNTDRTLTLPDEAGTVLTTAGVPASAMPAGSVIQVVYKNFSDVTVISNGADTFQTVTNGNLAVTSTVANSKFLVRMLAQGYQDQGSGGNIGMSRTISGATTRLLGTDGTSGNSWLGTGNGTPYTSYTILREYLDSPAQAAGTSITYNMLVAYWTSAAVFSVNYSGYAGESMITIEEIAP